MKRKKIKLKYGKVGELAKLCGVSPQKVSAALRWNSDNDNENLIRKRAYDYGFVKTF